MPSALSGSRLQKTEGVARDFCCATSQLLLHTNRLHVVHQLDEKSSHFGWNEPEYKLVMIKEKPGDITFMWYSAANQTQGVRKTPQFVEDMQALDDLVRWLRGWRVSTGLGKQTSDCVYQGHG